MSVIWWCFVQKCMRQREVSLRGICTILATRQRNVALTYDGALYKSLQDKEKFLWGGMDYFGNATKKCCVDIWWRFVQKSTRQGEASLKGIGTILATRQRNDVGTGKKLNNYYQSSSHLTQLLFALKLFLSAYSYEH